MGSCVRKFLSEEGGGDLTAFEVSVMEVTRNTTSEINTMVIGENNNSIVPPAVVHVKHQDCFTCYPPVAARFNHDIKLFTWPSPEL